MFNPTSQQLGAPLNVLNLTWRESFAGSCARPQGLGLGRAGRPSHLTERSSSLASRAICRPTIRRLSARIIWNVALVAANNWRASLTQELCGYISVLAVLGAVYG